MAAFSKIFVTIGSSLHDQIILLDLEE